MSGLAVLAPWIDKQRAQLLSQNGHAWLLQGPSGLGQYQLALELARAWLCERRTDRTVACGVCASCHAIEVRSHADLCVLMPEIEMLELAWPLGEKAQAEIDDKKRKPSKEIRVEAMRDAVEFSQRTSARGIGKVVLVFPAERMNNIAANALLKTLEEPPGNVKFVLATESAHQLLPTIRSRCIAHSMQWPEVELSLNWLVSLGVPSQTASLLLSASGGRPQNALSLHASGVNPLAWNDFPKAMQAGDVGFVKDWSLANLIDALQKLSHDCIAVKMGAKPRFFSSIEVAKHAPVASLTEWSKTLTLAMRTIEHPFNAGLALEAFVQQAKSALNSRP
ncbi:DNA polymerase III subunit delta' [Rhodoferax aquaticus]|uniref:DNA polymerase III subunit delta n=1 Tax=Rhodoferax aquaticus TaxID=2527691 RepID=A0A515EPN4_9BURK|nr:DNA polymerase III subunit delta' [Rhodoferax aquaticus]QDL54631.1 DNA polymerase III subunit delta' [Rhodoferax aquaticus]